MSIILMVISLLGITSIHAMDKALQKLQDFDTRKEVNLKAYAYLSSDEQKALGAEYYSKDPEVGRKVVEKLAHHAIDIAFQDKIFAEDELSFKQALKERHAQESIALREAALISAPAIKVINELTARARGVQLLAPEERFALQKDRYLADSEKAYKVINKMADLAYGEMVAANLLAEDISQEVFRARVIKSEIDIREKMFRNN